MSLRSLFSALLFAAVVSAQTPADLTPVLDQYIAAVKARDFQRIIGLYHAPAKKAVLADFNTPAEQKNFLKEIAEMAPDSYTSPTVDSGGDRVLLRVQAKKSMSAAMRKQYKVPAVVEKPMVVEFIREEGKWKMGPPSFTAPAAANALAPVADLKMGVRADYKDDANTQLGGPILRVEKQAAGTVYVIRVVDEEAAAFLPAALVKPEFQPGKIIVMQCAAHKQNSQKFWAEEAKLHQP